MHAYSQKQNSQMAVALILISIRYETANETLEEDRSSFLHSHPSSVGMSRILSHAGAMGARRP